MLLTHVVQRRVQGTAGGRLPGPSTRPAHHPALGRHSDRGRSPARAVGTGRPPPETTHLGPCGRATDSLQGRARPPHATPISARTPAHRRHSIVHAEGWPVSAAWERPSSAAFAAPRACLPMGAGSEARGPHSSQRLPASGQRWGGGGVRLGWGSRRAQGWGGKHATQAD